MLLQIIFSYFICIKQWIVDSVTMNSTFRGYPFLLYTPDAFSILHDSDCEAQLPVTMLRPSDHHLLDDPPSLLGY
jgi:hypothetical protein